MDWSCGPCWSRPAQALGAASGWLLWMFAGVSGARAAGLGLVVGLAVMVPWAVQRAVGSITRPPNAVLGNSARGRQL